MKIKSLKIKIDKKQFEFDEMQLQMRHKIGYQMFFAMFLGVILYTFIFLNISILMFGLDINWIWYLAGVVAVTAICWGAFHIRLARAGAYAPHKYRVRYTIIVTVIAMLFMHFVLRNSFMTVWTLGLGLFDLLATLKFKKKEVAQDEETDDCAGNKDNSF